MPIAPTPQAKEQRQETNIPNDKYIQIHVDKAVVRKSPDFDAIIIGNLIRDERFKILCTVKDKKGVIWYEIDFVEGQSGWVSNREKVD